MPLDVPNLDDRSWAQLVDESRALIPRVAPAWTDHNVHDPGITFIELLAWLAEMQLYQLNRVGERHREAFARLAGVARRHRIPARVALRVEGKLTAGTRLPAGTKLTPTGIDDLVFETDTDVPLTAGQLQRVVVDDGISVVDQTDANKRLDVVFLAFGENAGPGAALHLGFDALYQGERELRLAFDVFEEDLTAPCDDGATSRASASADEAIAISPVELIWEARTVAPSGWSPLRVIADSTHALMTSGVVTLSTPQAPVHEHGLMWIRVRIVRGNYDIEPRLRNVAVNVLPCSQRETIRDDRLNEHFKSEGPHQTYTLTRKPLMLPLEDPPRRLESSDVVDWDLLVEYARRIDADLAERLIDARSGSLGSDERALSELNRDIRRTLTAAGPLLGRNPVVVTVDGELWEPVQSFASSHSASKHFVVDVDEGRVLFGNGLNGRIPAKDADIRAVWYRTCAGARGNVAANQSWRTVAGGPAGVTLRNVAAASAGADPEILADLDLRGQANLRRPNRGVTARDLERLAIETPVVHVARAKAVPNYPQPETITVVVLPKTRPGRHRPRAEISDAFLNQVRRHLERHRLLCDQLRVIAPAFVEVSVSARLRVVKGAAPSAVIARASETLGLFFRGELDLSRDARLELRPPLDSPCPTRWPFGRAVRLSEVYAALESVGGVDTVWGVELEGRRAGTSVPRDSAGGIPLPAVGLVLAGTHRLVVEEPRRSRQ
jgi:hypothetical protein